MYNFTGKQDKIQELRYSGLFWSE